MVVAVSSLTIAATVSVSKTKSTIVLTVRFIVPSSIAHICREQILVMHSLRNAGSQ